MKKVVNKNDLIQRIAEVIRDYYSQDSIEDEKISLQCASDIVFEVASTLE